MTKRLMPLLPIQLPAHPVVAVAARLATQQVHDPALQVAVELVQVVLKRGILLIVLRIVCIACALQRGRADGDALESNLTARRDEHHRRALGKVVYVAVLYGRR